MPVDYSIKKEDPMDLDDDTKKALAAAAGKDISAIEKAAAAKGEHARGFLNAAS